MDADEWLTVRQAAALVAESEPTVRRAVARRQLRTRQGRANGRSVLQLAAEDVWGWRAERLQALQIANDPLLEDGGGPGSTPLRRRQVDAAAHGGSALTERDVLRAELARVTAALDIMFAADDANDERVAAAEEQLRAAEARVRAADGRADLLKGAARSLLR